jgi:hypothetical protein
MVSGNMDKHYLVDLARLGIPVVASQILERGSSPMLRDVLEENDWDKAVIKPCVSGAAQHTYRVNRQSSAA